MSNYRKRILIARMLIAWAALAAQAINAMASERSTANDNKADDRSVTISALEDFEDRQPTYFDSSLGVIIFDASVNGNDTIGILDTGSTSTFVNTHAATRWGLTFSEIEKKGEAIGGQFDVARLDDVVSIDFKGQIRAEAEFLAVDLSSASEAIGREIGVVIGMDVLSNLAFFIDKQYSRILFGSAETLTTNAPSAIALSLEGQYFNALINGKSAKFIFDTGSNFPASVVSKRWETYFPNADLTNFASSVSLIGDQSSSRGVENASVKFAGITMNTGVKIQDIDNVEHEAALGYPSLELGIFLFNYPKETIYIIPRE